MLNPMKFDADALRTRLTTRHGAELGTIVFDATMSNRRLEDDRHAELRNELTVIDQQTSDLCESAGKERAISQARLAAAHAAYVAMCADDQEADSAAQALIAPLRYRSLEIQEQLRALSQPRLTEREMADIAIFLLKDTSPSNREPATSHHA